MTRLLELSLLDLSGEAFRLYVTAYTRCNETGARRLSCAAMSNLPAAPRNPKALGKLLLELMAHGLVLGDTDGYEVPEVLSVAATRMRRVRADSGGTSSEHVRESFSQDPAEHGRTAPSPPAPPLPDSAGSGSEFSLVSPALSSGSKTESKRARKAPKAPYPADFDAEIKPRVFEWARGKHYPDWWTTDRLEQMRIDCGSKSIMFADWYLGAIGWLNREDKQYGNGPDALLARRNRNGNGVPPGLEAHNEHKQARGAAIGRRVWGSVPKGPQ